MSEVAADPRASRRSQVVVREARRDELDAVGDLTLRAYDGLDGPSFSEEYRTELGDARLRAATEAVIMVGLVDDVVAGSVALSVGHTEMFEHRFGVDGDCGFRMLAVAPEFQGRGVGGALVDECVRRCRNAGLRRMVITTMDRMLAAQQMYAQRGFVRRPDLDVRYSSGVGLAYHLDLVPDAADQFPPPGPVPDEPPWYEERPHNAHPCG